MAVMFQHARTHRDRQRQCHEARDDHRAGECQSELREELAGLTFGERDGCEHGSECEGHGDDREADLTAAPERRLQGRHALLDVAVDVLQHHDGIVHHETDGEHECEQGDGVDGEAHHVHQHQGADQRHRDRHQRNDAGAPVTQKQKDHQTHECDGFQNSDEDALDGLLHEK